MTLIVDGSDTYVTTGDDRPTDPTIDQAFLHQTTTYLAKFTTGAPDLATLASDTFTITFPEAVAAGMSLRLQPIAEDWFASQVTGQTIPAFTGTPVDTGALGALAAGATVTFDIRTLMQGVVSNTSDWYGIAITRLDAGAAAKIWTFDTTTGSGPVQNVAYYEPTAVPTGLVPAMGQIVSARQVLLQCDGFAASLGDTAITRMQVQWSTSSDFTGSLLASDVQATTSPTFDMTATQRASAGDGHTTSGSPTVTSATAAFTPYDVGTNIAGAGIPPGATITAYGSPTSVTISANATATATTVILTIGSGFQLPAPVGTTPVLRWWRCQVQAADGSWSGWSAPAQAGYYGLGTLVVDHSVPPFNVEMDNDPVRTYTFSETQAYNRITRRKLLDPATLLNDRSSTAARQQSTSQEIYAGYEVPDYDSYVDTIETWDDKNRVSLPGAPDHLTGVVTWSVIDDPSIQAPILGDLRSLADDSPFIVIPFTSPNLNDVFRLRVDSKIVAVWNGADIAVEEGEDGWLFEGIWYGAIPDTIYETIRVQRVTDHRGSAGSSPASFITHTTGSFLACPKTGDWVIGYDVDFGEWLRPSPNSVLYGSSSSPNWRKTRRQRMGYTSRITMDLWPDNFADDAVQVASFHKKFDRMCLTDEELIFVTPHEVFPVVIANDSDTPLDDPVKPRRIAFDIGQADTSTLGGSQFGDGGQVVTTIIDFESYANGDTVDEHDPSGIVLPPEGSIKAATSAAAHGSLMGALLKDVAGGSNLPVIVNPLSHSVDTYWKNGWPSRTDEENLYKLDSGGGQASAVHFKTAGQYNLLDQAGTVVAKSASKVGNGIPFRSRWAYSWIDGVGYPRFSVWSGLNIEGSQPDIDLAAAIPTPTIPDALLRTGPVTVFGGGDLAIDDVRVSNDASMILGPVGAGASTTLTYALASAMDHTTIRVAANGIVGDTHVKLAYSTTQGADGQPASPAFSSAVAVDSDAHADLVVTGLTPHTRYYYAVADSAGVIAPGGTGSCPTLSAPNTPVTLKIFQGSCQAAHSDMNIAWVDASAWGADIGVFQGDLGYWGGNLTPTMDYTKHLPKYLQVLGGKAAMRQCLANFSNEHQISDHEVAGNGEYKNPGDPTAIPPIDAFFDWAGQLPIYQANILAFRKAVPVVYSDTATTPRGRYYYKDLVKNRSGGIVSVRLFMLDHRCMDRSDGLDIDGPAKTYLGAPQLAWLSANLLPAGHGLNIIADEGAWYADPIQPTQTASDGIDKWWAFNWEQVNTIAPMFSGKSVDYWGGDRHKLGFLDHTRNPIGNFDVCLASAMEMHGLKAADGEIYLDAAGVSRVYGDNTGLTNYVYGRITLTDDNAGTITRTFSGWDAKTATDKINGPYTRTFAYT